MATSTIKQQNAVTYLNPYSGVRVYKSGNIVEISFEGFSAQQAYSANESLFTLPEEYRPRYSLSFLDALNSGKRIAVESTGKVYVTSALSSGNLLRGCAVYIV